MQQLWREEERCAKALISLNMLIKVTSAPSLQPPVLKGKSKCELDTNPDRSYVSSLLCKPSASHSAPAANKPELSPLLTDIPRGRKQERIPSLAQPHLPFTPISQSQGLLLLFSHALHMLTASLQLVSLHSFVFASQIPALVLLKELIA